MKKEKEILSFRPLIVHKCYLPPDLQFKREPLGYLASLRPFGETPRPRIFHTTLSLTLTLSRHCS